MLSSRRTLRHILSLLLLAPIAIASGCSSGPSRDYVAEYEAGRYATAYTGAVKAAKSDSASKRDQGALLAGLSAHALKRSSEAERWLKPLVTHSDRQIAGRAGATMGLIALERKQYDQAAAFLSKASTQLSGNEAAQAGLHAGDAYSSLGRADSARLQYNLAFALATDARLKGVLSSRLDRAGYTLQLGAFSAPENAERAAREAASTSIGLGLGSPRVVPSTDVRGRPLYMVRVGRFKTKVEAEEGRRRLGHNSIVATAPADE